MDFMSKPHEFSVSVDKCPRCGEPGEGVYYMPADPTKALNGILEAVVHHGINNQTTGRVSKALGRNEFCRTGNFRKVDDSWFKWSRRANPQSAPRWDRVNRRLF